MQKIGSARERRQRKSRRKIAELGAVRLSVNRTPRHIYAQIFSSDGSSVLVCASSLEKVIRVMPKEGKQSVAREVGKLVAERAREKGIQKIAFDRSGYKYHGRIKALADGARENGLDF